MFTYRKISIAGLAAFAAATPLFAGAVRAAASTGPPLNIVAIGDSYASGQGDMGSGWLDATCYRSYNAAARLAEEDLNRPVNFTFLACNGSTISNSNPAQSLLGSGGQLDTALSMADPGGSHPVDAMTISIGGNNIGFSNIVTNCLAPFNSCSTDPNVTGLSGVGTVSQALQALEGTIPSPQGFGNLVQLVQQVNSHPDIENVYLTEYPDPTTGPVDAAGDNNLCGSPADPPFSFPESDISADDAYWASNSVIQQLNAALQGAVSMGNSQSGTHAVWHYVSGISSAFYTHGYCNPNTGPNGRFVNTLTDSVTTENLSQTGTMHPNDEGQHAIANILYNDYVTGNVMSASVSTSPPAVAEAPTNLTVQALSFAGTPVANAAVLVDGTQAGYTNSAGSLVVSNHEFPTAGNHTIVVQENGWASAQAVVAVQPRPYGATSSPSPIPVKTLIPALTLTATDNATGQTIPGTFTFGSGSATPSLRSGVTASNITVAMGHKTKTIIGSTGKPIQVTVPACPTLTFQPDSAAYASQDFTKLINCSTPV